MITTAHAHKSGVIFYIFPRAFNQKKKINALRPKMTKIASGGPALRNLGEVLLADSLAPVQVVEEGKLNEHVAASGQDNT